MNGNLITDDIRTYAKCLRLSNFAQNCSDYFHKAQIDKPTYQDFILNVLKTEVEERQKRELQRRIKKAKQKRAPTAHQESETSAVQQPRLLRLQPQRRYYEDAVGAIA